MTASDRLPCTRTVVLVLACVLLLPRPTPAADGDLSSYTLPNGLRIHVIERHAAPVAAVQVWYRTGSLNEHPGIRGLSHLFEHMMFRGSEHFGPEEHFRRISQLGGRNNAYTDPDVTVYHQVVPVSGVDLVMEMEADRMARLELDEKILETEVEVVKEEYRVNYENDPLMRVLRQFYRQYFGDHPYGTMVIGNMAELDTVTVGTCLAYYRARYVPNNAALIVAGDVEPGKILEMAARHFGPIPAAATIEPDPPPPASTPLAKLVGRDEIPVPITGVGYRLPPAGDPDIPALEILDSILQDRLDWRLTRQSSLCVYANNEEFTNRQVSMVAFMGVHLPNIPPEKVRDAIEAEIARFLSGPVPLDELDRTRNQTLLNETLGRSQVESIARGVGEALFLAGDIERYTKRLEHLAALTPERLMECARRHFTPQNRTEIRIAPAHPSFLYKVLGWLKTTFRV